MRSSVGNSNNLIGTRMVQPRQKMRNAPRETLPQSHISRRIQLSRPGIDPIAPSAAHQHTPTWYVFDACKQQCVPKTQVRPNDVCLRQTLGFILRGDLQELVHPVKLTTHCNGLLPRELCERRPSHCRDGKTLVVHNATRMTSDKASINRNPTRSDRKGLTSVPCF